jgi:hypothetical protein
MVGVLHNISLFSTKLGKIIHTHICGAELFSRHAAKKEPELQVQALFPLLTAIICSAPSG